MKRFELIFAFIQLPVDYALLVLAGFAAYTLRYAPVVTSIRPILFNLPWPKYWPLVLAVAAGWTILFAFSGLYHTNPNRKLARDLTRVVMACSTGFAGITIYIFFASQKFDSRFLVLAGWILAIVFVVAGRIILRGLKFLCYRLGYGLRRTVIIGEEKLAQTIFQTLRSRRSLGYAVINCYEHFDAATARKIISDNPDEIIFANPRAAEDEALAAIDFANERHVTFKYSADLFATISTNLAVSTIAGVPIIELGRTRLGGWGSIIKRLADLFFAIVLVISLLPVYLIISLIILLETGRPIIYRNERVGQRGKKFLTLKFRSMYQKDCTGEQFGATGFKALKKEEQLIADRNIKSGPVYKIKDDPRVTPFGKFLRRFSLDELPQFVNVLAGDMSLVGPRPHQPREVAKYEQRHKIVLAIRPGVTGLAQISGRSDLSFEEEVRLDTFYIEHWSLLIDLIIFIKTPFIVLKRKGAL